MRPAVDEPGGVEQEDVAGEVADEDGVPQRLVPPVVREGDWDHQGEDHIEGLVVPAKQCKVSFNDKNYLIDTISWCIKVTCRTQNSRKTIKNAVHVHVFF